MRKLTTILLLQLVAISFLFAQTGPGKRRDAIFNLPPGVQAPRWITDTDWEHPNIFSIDAAIAAFENDNHSEASEKKGNGEDPYVMAYMRWRRSIEPFIQADGSVVEKPGYYDQVLKNAINAQAKNKQQSASARIAGSANWTVLGPIETFTEAKSKISLQVNMYSIAIAPSNPNILYAGSETGVIFRSTDKGLHWASISDVLPLFSATSIAVDHTNPNIVYAVSERGEIIKTTDAGSQWAYLSGYQGGRTEKITINKNTGRILVAGDKGVYYSNNNGSTWQLASGSSADRMWDVEINAVNTDLVYAVGKSQAGAIMILRSTNGGASFSAVNSSSLNNVSSQDGARFGVTPANGNTVYCITLGGLGVAPRLLKSTDAGVNWNISFTGGTQWGTFINGQGFYDLDILVSPTNENHLITGTYEPFKSVDGGLTFSSIKNMGYPIHADVQCMRALGNDTYMCTDGGIDHSTDFFTNINNWSARNHGLTGADYWGFDQGWDQDLIVGGRYHNGDAALFDKYGPGNALSVLGGSEEPTGHVFHGKKNTVGFLLHGVKEVPSSLPGNVTIPAAQNSKWPQVDYYGIFSSKLMIDPCYSNTYYVGGGRGSTVDSNILWKSVNNGISYTALHDFGSKVWRFDIARSNRNVLYVCTKNGIFKTTDGGQGWTSLTLPTGVTYNYYNADIAVDQLNENIVFLCMRHGIEGQKVFKSINGGATWVNYTGILTKQPIAFIVPQAGTNGGVYAIANEEPQNDGYQVYYRDNALSDWIPYSSGLPRNFRCRQGGIIFYRDNKLRMAGNRGIWESPLYSTGTPVAQPMADRQFLNRSVDTVYFTDYSNLNHSGATWKWTFPGASYVSSTTDREPKVVYTSPGSYSVTLEVTDASGNKNTRTINNMITQLASAPGNYVIDTVPGKCLQMAGSTAIDLGKVNINSNNFSISCWIKPNGLQKSFSQIIAHGPYPGSGTRGLGIEFAFQGTYTPTLELAYTDGSGGWRSGLFADSETWNFVVLTYSPTGVKLYLNGVPFTVNGNNWPVVDLSQSPFYVNKDIHGQGGAYKGAIDEIKFYNYALSQDEVREKMHLIQKSPAENGLLKYFQFNQYNSNAGTVPDLMSTFEALIPNASFITASTAPVAAGKVFRKPNVNAGGLHSFPGTGIDLYLKNGGTYPNGEVVAFQLNAAPDQNPGTLPLAPASTYFIINNYGDNKTITAPDSIRFSGLNINEPAYSATEFRLYKRASGAFGATWGNELSRSTGFGYAPGNSIVSFGTGNNVTTFGQFALSASPLKAGDTVAGKCVTVSAYNDTVNLGKVNINSNNFSISCWIKPNGLQKSFSQLIAHDPYPGSIYGFGLGFSFSGYAPNLELVYTDNKVEWTNRNLNLIADSATWNFVVLTYSPTGVKIYLNGEPFTANPNAMPAIDLSQSPFYVNKDIHGQGGAYKGAIDEIKFYNYTLSQEEVREKMHLIQKYPGTENGLLKYFQFNQYNSSTGKVPDLVSDFEATIPNASFITASTAPVATGKVFRRPNVNAAGLYYFPGPEVLFSLKSGATYPNGEVVAFQLDAAPDQNPGTLPLAPRSKYFIINNYGTNKTFTAPELIAFSGLDLTSGYSATDFHLFKRASGAFGATWGNELSRSTHFNYGPGNSNVGFNTGNNVTSFGQFALTAPAAARLSATTPGENTVPNNNALTTAEFYPNPNKGWGYLNISSPYNNGHVTLYLQDINGNIVYKASEQLNGSNKAMMLLNLHGIPSGAYVLQIRFNTGELITKKVMIVK
ncbi:PKD domain-containing protein [Niastella caeni]|uniref:PKD domain-containing protein n=1 Tax=Niastella caeni TaxID=2569763 RepID=A0A4S8H6Q0_9BACT|nr:LamG-like jellyroll fold domain-containing protein [Niastella caeni]THU30237.1 PKD domain-containing protein [Niastella caeni]